MKDQEQKIRRHLRFLYDNHEASQAFQDIRELMGGFGEDNSSSVDLESREGHFTEEDIVLIAYGDQVCSPGKPPLRALSQFLRETVKREINILHLLPFFPYSSDDGFAVKDYWSVKQEYGNWSDIHRLGEDFELMFDAVINHVSRESKWFRRYMKGDSEFKDFFIDADGSWDLSEVVRPRDNPLFVEVEREGETKLLWSTFSSDQVDLNYRNPEVLVRTIDLLLFYVAQGAKIIRLDAIAYLWKKSGTSCIHLEETHRVIRIFRAVLAVVAPHVKLITETNVPHEQNVSYFGDGGSEAHMVYQFSLPPLVLDAFIKGSSSTLSQWARQLEFPTSGATFFNFLASHDGIGLRPAEGILSEKSIEQMVKTAKNHGGFVSYKTDPDGGKSPYELNISYFDALSDPKSSESRKLQVKRFISSQAIILSFRGVPGIYFHSLFGSRNWEAGVKKTGRKRSINREKLRLSNLTEELTNPDSLRTGVLERYKRLLQIRMNNEAFSPSADQRVVDLVSEVFAILRTPSNPDNSILCLHNVTEDNQRVHLKQSLVGKLGGDNFRDLVSGRSYRATSSKGVEITLTSYDILWLKGEGQ